MRWLCLLTVVLVLQTAREGKAQNAAKEMFTRCVACHAPKDDAVDVVTMQRKTPEGWEMTLVRMMRMHGAQLQPDEVRLLVKYLSDHYGLAPVEVEPFSYMVEKRNAKVVQHDIPKFMQAACTQCHSYERIALQRRTAESWEHLPDTKLALFANTENVTASSGLLQDYWFEETKKTVVPYLAKQFPFVTEAWTAWQAKPTPDYAGNWKIVGHDPGEGGDYVGHITLTALGDDRYEGDLTLEFSDGRKTTGKTTGLVYTGFQWRGARQIADGKSQREILFASEDGSSLRGRRIVTPVGDLGMDETWYRNDKEARVLAIAPVSVRSGEKRTVRIFGMNLPTAIEPTAIDFSAGVTVQSVRQENVDVVLAEVTVANEAQVGVREVRLQGANGTVSLTVYDVVDYIRLVPEMGFARPGGVNVPKVHQQFEAFAYHNGPDGKKGTRDDIKLHRVSLVKWNVNEYVKRLNDDDVQFVGTVDAHGLFVPAKDGPNPQRHMMDHNVGDVWVEGWYRPDGAKRPMGARAYLLVMPEKFNFQPIE
ncbi:MAG: quinohemoprotein amine dehydrogenase subunit alpha [Candidatus Binatia bacterium]